MIARTLGPMDKTRPVQWRTVLQGVLIVYGTSFLSGVAFAFSGIAPQTDPVAYPILALLMEAVGVAIALYVAGTTRLSYLVTLGIGIWLVSATSVWLGVQSLIGWLLSTVFIAMTVIVGRLLLGIRLDQGQSTIPTLSTISQKSRSGARIYHTKPSGMS